MKTLLMAVTVISFVGMLFSPGAFAQVDRPASPPGSPPPASSPSLAAPTMPGQAVFTSDLIGADVKNPEGQSLGKVSQLVVDRQDARIASAVVSVGGVLGIGSREVAIPWKDLMLENDGRTVVVSMSKEELEAAPEWQKPREAPTAAPGSPAERPATPPSPR